MSPGRVAVQDMAADHGRLYVAMAVKFLDRADIVTPSKRVRRRQMATLGKQHCLPAFCRVVLNMNEFLFMP